MGSGVDVAVGKGVGKGNGVLVGVGAGKPLDPPEGGGGLDPPLEGEGAAPSVVEPLAGICVGSSAGVIPSPSSGLGASPSGFELLPGEGALSALVASPFVGNPGEIAIESVGVAVGESPGPSIESRPSLPVPSAPLDAFGIPGKGEGLESPSRLSPIPEGVNSISGKPRAIAEVGIGVRSSVAYTTPLEGVGVGVGIGIGVRVGLVASASVAGARGTKSSTCSIAATKNVGVGVGVAKSEFTTMACGI